MEWSSPWLLHKTRRSDSVAADSVEVNSRSVVADHVRSSVVDQGVAEQFALVQGSLGNQVGRPAVQGETCRETVRRPETVIIFG